jgi:hypothetical protein
MEFGIYNPTGSESAGGRILVPFKRTIFDFLRDPEVAARTQSSSRF